MNRTSREVVDTIRLLAQRQDHIPASDLWWLFQSYKQPPEGAHAMLSLGLFDEQEQESNPLWPLLATALRGLSSVDTLHLDYPKWESLIRRLLHRGVDLHAPTSRLLGYIDPEQAYHKYSLRGRRQLSPFGTPLDELFDQTNSPFDSMLMAERWLNILASEGRDVHVYLEQERAMHAPRPYFTLPPSWGLDVESSRELVFEIGRENPIVSWNWWVDPDSPAALVLGEFNWISRSYQKSIWKGEPWTVSWPFGGMGTYDLDDNEMEGNMCLSTENPDMPGGWRD